MSFILERLKNKKDIIVGVALEDAKAGEPVQISFDGIHGLKKIKPKKLLGKTVDEEKTELEKWFDLLDLDKKKKEKVSLYSAGSGYHVIGSTII